MNRNRLLIGSVTGIMAIGCAVCYSRFGYNPISIIGAIVFLVLSGIVLIK